MTNELLTLERALERALNDDSAPALTDVEINRLQQLRAEARADQQREAEPEPHGTARIARALAQQRRG